MFNPVDTRQIGALVDHRREQVATDAGRVRQANVSGQSRRQSAGRFRALVGVQLIKVGARIAGVYVRNDLHLRPGF